MEKLKGIIAVTGASGSLYARLTIGELLKNPSVGELAVVVSPNGRAVAQHEGVALPDSAADSRLRYYAHDDLFAPPASGSARYDFMAVVPCSMGTAGRIAAGISDSLIGRAADVMLKERRRLCLVVRETPLSLIHLRNLTSLTEAGAVVLPASPSFYSRPGDVKTLCLTVVHRLCDLLTGSSAGYRWGGPDGDRG
ncbi:MAG: UbiX family flavin prenyltransferase [Rikenellaceae bacterium]|nr:UbiX family flavin prenyltransferase [Rikenellaceae bacterium]